MSEKRGSWYLLTGLVLGLVVGLAYSWWFSPIGFTETTPAALRADFKGEYRALIAAAYAANGDLVRAAARLELLADLDPAVALLEQAQQTRAAGGSPQRISDLESLAVALSPAAAATPANTAPAAATAPPAPAGSPSAAFVLQDSLSSCEPPLDEPQIQVQALDAAGQPLGGVEIVVTWEGGEERFFTGLQPEKGSGYADFTLTPGVVYSLQIPGSRAIPALEAVACPGSPASWAAWQLTFQQQ